MAQLTSLDFRGDRLFRSAKSPSSVSSVSDVLMDLLDLVAALDPTSSSLWLSTSCDEESSASECEKKTNLFSHCNKFYMFERSMGTNLETFEPQSVVQKLSAARLNTV